MVQDVSIGECLSEGWERFKPYIWLTLGVNIVYFIIVMVGGIIPIVGFIFSLLVAPIFGFGLYYYFLNVARGSNPRFEDLFAGFNRYGTIIGFNFLYMGVMVVGMLPSIIYGFAIIVRIISGDIGPENFPWTFIIVIILNALLLVFGLVRYWLTYFVIMDDPRRGLFASLQRSADITKYNSHNVILMGIAAWFIMMALIIALVIPVLIFGPFVAVGFARMYEKLKAMHPEATPQPSYPSEPPPATM